MNENDENKYPSTTQNVDDKKRMMKIADSITEGKRYDNYLSIHLVGQPLYNEKEVE